MNTYRRVQQDVFIGAQPDAGDLARLKEQGVRTVIDLRLQTEPQANSSALVKESGLNYVNIPVEKSKLSIDLISRLRTEFRGDAGPYVVHCATGVRAALMTALLNAQDEGWSFDQTIEAITALGADITVSPEFLSFVQLATSAKT